MTFQFSVLFHRFIMSFSCLSALLDISPIPMTQHSLFVLKVPLNTKLPSNQPVVIFISVDD